MKTQTGQALKIITFQKSQKVEVTIDGVPNQLYSKGMSAYQQWDEIIKYFELTSKRDKETDKVAKGLCFTDTTVQKYFTIRFALWLGLHSTDDNSLHGSGRKIENASEGVNIQMEKKQESDENLNIYLYIIQNAQINFEDGGFKEVVFKSDSHAAAPSVLPKYLHSAIICGQTGCGKTEFVLD